MIAIDIVVLAGAFALLRRWARRDVFTAPPVPSAFQ